MTAAPETEFDPLLAGRHVAFVGKLGGVTKLTLDTDGSFNLDNTGTLTDLDVTLDPSGAVDETYVLTQTAGLDFFEMTDESGNSDLIIGRIDGNMPPNSNCIQWMAF